LRLDLNISALYVVPTEETVWLKGVFSCNYIIHIRLFRIYIHNIIFCMRYAMVDFIRIVLMVLQIVETISHLV